MVFVGGGRRGKRLTTWNLPIGLMATLDRSRLFAFAMADSGNARCRRRIGEMRRREREREEGGGNELGGVVATLLLCASVGPSRSWQLTLTQVLCA
jgi:hypothetical protein